VPPEQASAHANQAIDALDSLWVARTAPQDRAYVAEALAALWTHLDPTDAAARAQSVAAHLEGALRDARDGANEIPGLVSALAAVYHHLAPAERSRRASAVVDVLFAVLRRPRLNPVTGSLFSQALASLCAHLDRPGAIRTADALLAVLHDPYAQPDTSGPILSTHPDRFVLHEPLVKKLAARLDERDLQRLLDHHLAVGRFQRVILDVLGGMKKRSFRNTWDYLDWTESNGKA
jgi:hypothetical protein